MDLQPCFFMVCTSKTEEECIQKGLFGDREWVLQHLRSIQRNHIGFLYNVSRDQLLGVFQAEGPAGLNIDPGAWGGGFPAQVKVRLVGDLQRIDDAAAKLGEILELRLIDKGKHPYKVPAKRTHGPTVTEKVLSLFTIPAELRRERQREAVDIGILPKYDVEDVAGLSEVKQFIYQRIIAPFEDEQTAFSLRLRVGGGMLLFGPPGTGKTLIAMSIARRLEARFIEISPSVIVGYPGEAEKRLERILGGVDREPRSVVFLDESEWVLCKREDQTSSVMQRITPVLLAQLSRIFKDRTRAVVVIAATNKPEMIDPAFLRPGRFDKIFYIGLPDRDARKRILDLQLRERAHALTEAEIGEIAERLEGFSGADIENIIEEAAFRAFRRRNEGEVSITKKDVEAAMGEATRSVTAAEIERLERWAQERGLRI